MSGMSSPALACDVLVVGGGTAGFTAAVAAAQSGARVIVIEKNARVGGEGMVSGSNGMFGGGTDYQRAAGIEDSPERFLDDMARWDPWADPEVLEAYTRHTVATIHFLRDQGVEWTLNPSPVADGGDSVGRVHTVVGRGPALYGKMVPALERAGGRILTSTTAVRLQVDAGGAVTGVVARDAGGAVVIAARSTILTCGGFQGNAEMMTRYVSREAASALLRGVPTNTGDGVLLGLEARASTRAMEAVHGYVHVPPFPIPYPFQPYGLPHNPPDGRHASSSVSGGVPGLTMQGFAHCIVVDAAGERFADESRPRVGEQMCNALLRQPGAVGYTIADRPLYEAHLAEAVEDAAAGWKELGYGAPRVETAATVHELAAKLRMSPTVLGSTVEEYNRAVHTGSTHLLRVPKANAHPTSLYQTLGLNFLHPIETPPFYAVLVIAGYSHSKGGLATNGKAQVLDREKNVIPGLYAAGDTAVLWHGNYANAYSQAHTQGYIAATDAAALLR